MDSPARTARERILALVANQLHGLGFHHLALQGLKPKHVQALAQRRTIERRTVGTERQKQKRAQVEPTVESTLSLGEVAGRVV